MELDDLKKPWQQATANNMATTNIANLIQNKKSGPAANLLKRFRRQLIILPLLVAFLIRNLSRHHDLLSDVLFWCFMVTVVAMCAYFLFTYRLLSAMQDMERPVKNRLERQVAVLEKGYKIRLGVVRALVVFYVILLEVLLYSKQEPSLVKWYAQPVSVRLLCYGLLIVAFYFISRAVFSYKYGKPIHQLKELVQQME